MRRTQTEAVELMLKPWHYQQLPKFLKWPAALQVVGTGSRTGQGLPPMSLICVSLYRPQCPRVSVSSPTMWGRDWRPLLALISRFTLVDDVSAALHLEDLTDSNDEAT